MDVVFHVKQLKEVVDVVSKVAAGRDTMPLLACMVVRAEIGSDRVDLEATDLEIGIQTSVEANIEAGGDVALPARKLKDIVSSLPQDGDVSVKVKGTRAEIRSGKAFFRLIGMDPSEFPSMAALPDPHFVADAAVLRRAFSRTLFCVSSDETRYFLGGVYFASENAVFVATDGKQLAVAPIELAEVADETRCIIPAVGVRAFMNTFADGTVSFALSENHMVFSDGTTVLTVRLIEGEYPDYTAVIGNAAPQFSMVADTTRLTTALRRVSLMSSPKTPRVYFCVMDNMLRLSANDVADSMGDAEETMAVEHDGNLKTAFNANYLMGAIGAADAEKVTFKFNGPLQPVMVAGDDAWQGLLMPMRV